MCLVLGKSEDDLKESVVFAHGMVPRDKLESTFSAASIPLSPTCHLCVSSRIVDDSHENNIVSIVSTNL